MGVISGTIKLLKLDKMSPRRRVFKGLDDLIDQKKSTVSKTSKSPGGASRGRRGGSSSSRGRSRGGRAVRNPVGIGSRLRQRSNGAAGIGKKTPVGIKSRNLSLRAVEEVGGLWRHDKFEEAAAATVGGEIGAAGAPLESGTKLLVSNLEKSVSSIELKVQNRAKRLLQAAHALLGRHKYSGLGGVWGLIGLAMRGV